MAIADAEGLDALTMKSLAGRLGVGTMTLYGYFADKSALLDAVVDAAVLDPGRRAPSFTGTTEAWRSDLKALMAYAYANLGRHPAITQIRLRMPVLRPDALMFGELVMQILLRAGLEAADAASAFRTLYTYLFGYAALSPHSATDANRAAARSAISALPEEQYPTLTRHRTTFSNAMAGRAQFSRGLELLLDGIESQLNP